MLVQALPWLGQAVHTSGALPTHLCPPEVLTWDCKHGRPCNHSEHGTMDWTPSASQQERVPSTRHRGITASSLYLAPLGKGKRLHPQQAGTGLVRRENFSWNPGA